MQFTIAVIESSFSITPSPNRSNLIVSLRAIRSKGKEEMISQTSRNDIRKRVHTRIRERMMGTSERPRLNIYRSLNHIYAQVIDDAGGVTIGIRDRLREYR